MLVLRVSFRSHFHKEGRKAERDTRVGGAFDCGAVKVNNNNKQIEIGIREGLSTSFTDSEH